jgi:choline-sulfatase
LKAATASGAIGANVGCGLPGARAASNPNILLLITDQQSSKMMSVAGNPWLKTPAMDGVANFGVRFGAAYSANPVCLPSRFTMLTGRYPSAVGVRHNGSKPTEAVNSFPQRAMGNIIRPAGYETVYGGKVHLPGPMNKIAECGFEKVLTNNEREVLAEECVKYLRGPHARPFLMVASFINPHDICYMAIRDYALSQAGSAAAKGNNGNPDAALATRVPPELDQALKMPPGVSEREFYARYCPPLPPNFDVPPEEPDAIRWLAKSRPFRQHARETWSAEKWRLHRWAYCRLTERVDSQLGRVLAALHETGLDENTIVIMTSDHGDHDSAHRLEHKTTFYEESAHIPLIICAPGQRNGGSFVQEPLISTGLDILPTICDYVGVEPPAGLHGRSLRPFVEGKTPGPWRDTLFAESEIGYMVTDGSYKYSAFDPDKGKRRDSLVDLRNDPGEMQNLVGRGEERPNLLRLRAAMADWQRQNGIQFEMPA